MIKVLGGRKTLLTLLVFFTSIVFLVLARLDSNEFLEIVKTLLIAYPAGNGIQKILPNVASDGNVGRKFWLVLLIYITVAILFGFNLIDGSVYMQISNWLIATYITGNVLSKTTKAFSISKR